jgi:hypothetical protein
MKVYQYIKKQFKHKWSHLNVDYFKNILAKHGLALFIIVVGWELVEDIIFPYIFLQLGAHINPVFYAGIPASLLLCFHWVAVPILWGVWIKISGKKEDVDEHICSHVCEAKEHDHE